MTQRREMRDGMREAGRNVRGLGVFRLVKRCVCTFFFFFFFLNFGLTRPFRPIRTESARFWPCRRQFPPNRRRLQPRRPASARFRTCHVAQRGPTRHGRAICGVPAASLRPAASDAGAPAPRPSPCIPGFN